MSLLFPAMLAGLAGLSVPVVLHLIAKQRFKVQDLPTIRLLDQQKRTNVLAPRLVDRWQLLLRLLVLLLAVLAMARWYAEWSPGAAAARNVVLVIDTSASMRLVPPAEGGTEATTLFERARGHARAVVAALAPTSRCGLICDGPTGAIDLAPSSDVAAVLAAIDGLTTIDGPGRGMVRSVADACDLLHGRREVASQVVVLTDRRASAFQGRDQVALDRIAAAARDLGAKLDIAFVDLGAGDADNVGIVDAYVRGGEAKVGEDAHVVATLVAEGKDAVTAKLRLAVAERRDPQERAITLKPGVRTVVDLTTRVNRAAQAVARVGIDGDAFADDDGRSVPLIVREARRILIVNGGESAPAAGGHALDQVAALSGGPAGAAPGDARVDGATILRYALNPGRELGLAYGTGIETTQVTPEVIASQPLSTFELIVLYDVSSLSDQAMNDLRGFVEQGRALLIIASGETNAVAYNRTLASGTGEAPPLSPARLGNDQQLDPAVGIRIAEDNILLAPFHDPLQGDLAVVRFHARRELADLPPGASVLIAGTDGVPLAVESPLGRGRVVLLATGCELARGNLARTRVFPTFLWRLVDYLTGRLRARPADDVLALTPAVLDVSEPALSLVERLQMTPVQPPGAPIDLEPAADGSVLVPPLAAGSYLLHRARPASETGPVLGYVRPVTSHIDPRESAMPRLPADQLAPLFGASARILPPDELAGLAPRGGELTRLLITLLVLAYAVEAIAGWLGGIRRERRLRAAEGIAA